MIPSYQIQALVVDNAQDPVPETDTADRQCQQEEIQYRIAAWHPVVCELTIDKLCNRRTGSGTYDIDQFVGTGITPDTAVQLPQDEKEEGAYNIRNQEILTMFEKHGINVLKRKIVSDI